MADTATHVPLSEAARRLGLTVRTLHRFIAEGKLSSAQPAGPGGKHMVPVGEVERLLRPGRFRAAVQLDGLINVTAEITALLTHAQGEHDHGRLARVFAGVADRAQVAERYHAARALDGPAPRPMPPIDAKAFAAQSDAPRLTAAELEAGAQLGAEHDAAEPEHGPTLEQVLASATPDEIAAAMAAAKKE